MSGPEVAKTPGGRAPGKEGMEAVANGHAGECEQGGGDPFAEYMWMENEDAYNRQVEEELLEQEFLERCFQEMLDEEDQDWFIPARDLPSGMGQLQQQLNGLSVSDGGNAEEMALHQTQSSGPQGVQVLVFCPITTQLTQIIITLGS
ncbi:polyadenylate-binding protein-interacting protein 2B-like isoform X2 [Oncorhynchus masou masou]|uniref:polyadenylate-binding protein-interacting protein 2B-like isoform X2 n=1 Tax=Oncorhynchus masou masou TaxID=90313 RepID=UPI00318351D7